MKNGRRTLRERIPERPEDLDEEERADDSDRERIVLRIRFPGGSIRKFILQRKKKTDTRKMAVSRQASHSEVQEADTRGEAAEQDEAKRSPEELSDQHGTEGNLEATQRA